MLGTHEKPRLQEQPGFSSVRLRELILPNPVVRKPGGGDDIQKTKTAYGDDADSLSTGLCSYFYVSR